VQWISEATPGAENSVRRRVALAGGDAMRAAVYRPFIEAFSSGNTPVDVTPVLRALMRHKRPRELALMREACGVLKAASDALAAAARSGASATAAILEAERAAYHGGTQDVRALFSLDGGRTLRPFEAPIDSAIDPLQVYIAVRYAGYWVDGFVHVASAPNPVITQANEALKALIEIAKAEIPCRKILSLAEEKIKPYGPHPITAGNIGNSIGTFLEETPHLRGTGNDKLEAGCTYTLRVGASDGREHHAIASALLAIGPQGNEVLWSAL
jgi:Xaa-Pro aminopeptidase